MDESGVSLLQAFDAFVQEHRRCGTLERTLPPATPGSPWGLSKGEGLEPGARAGRPSGRVTSWWPHRVNLRQDEENSKAARLVLGTGKW